LNFINNDRFIADKTKTMDDLQGDLKQLETVVDVMQDLTIEMGLKNFELFYRAIAWPKTIQKGIREADEMMVNRRERFLEDLKHNQEVLVCH
jgi:hypothetical protein